MTPAEQGQERWTIYRCECGATWKQNERQPDMTHTCRGESVEVVPAAELEMCQRYFPFMRRSRDEAVKREKALRAAIEEHRDRDTFKSTKAEANRKLYAALDQSGKP